MRKVEKPEALELLETYKRGLPAGECLPCLLARGVAPAPAPIAQGEHGVVLLNRFAQRRGHLMVIARRHVEHIHELSWQEYSALQRLAYDAGAVLARVLCPVRVWNAVLGSAAPALPSSYSHLHVHVVPVYENDERARPARVFSWSEGVFVYDEGEAEALAHELRAAYAE